MLETWRSAIDELDCVRSFGRVKLVGAERIESVGPSVGVGATVSISRHGLPDLLAEVVGFRSGRLVLTPLGPATGLEPEAKVSEAKSLARPAAQDLLGRVVDGMARPIDQGGQVPPGTRRFSDLAPCITERCEVSEVFETGLRVVDALLTCGRGQRLGVFAGAGVGKSTLLSMLLRSSRADAVVLGLVGERGREVRRFVDREISEECRGRTIVVATTSGEPAMLRVRAAHLAAELADELRQEGKHVLLIMDSLTRLAMAQREVGLASGEAPTVKGYPPSVFSLLPRIVERAGAYSTGSVTAFYSVLVEGDDMSDPVADSLRGLLDGHFVLSRDLAERGLFPAIDVLQSLSRLMPDLSSAEHVEAARRLRRLLGVRRDTEDLVRVGAYRAGSDPLVDEALAIGEGFEQLLAQSVDEKADMSESVNALAALTAITENVA